VDWGNGRGETIAQLQREARESGSFVDRAIMREVKIASELFAERHSAWMEVAELVERWQNGAKDLRVLNAVRHINRSASCWKTIASPIGAGGGGQAACSSADARLG
jgi:hypothetical protein